MAKTSRKTKLKVAAKASRRTKVISASTRKKRAARDTKYYPGPDEYFRTVLPDTEETADNLGLAVDNNIQYSTKPKDDPSPKDAAAIERFRENVGR